MIMSSKSDRSMSQILVIRLPVPALEMRMSGLWPSCWAMIWSNNKVMSVAERRSTLWVEMRRSGWRDCRSAWRDCIAARLVE